MKYTKHGDIDDLRGWKYLSDPKIELSVEKTAASSHNIGDIAKDISDEQFGTLDF